MPTEQWWAYLGEGWWAEDPQALPNPLCMESTGKGVRESSASRLACSEERGPTDAQPTTPQGTRFD